VSFGHAVAHGPPWTRRPLFGRGPPNHEPGPWDFPVEKEFKI
jgi:hypothetical protein